MRKLFIPKKANSAKPLYFLSFLLLCLLPSDLLGQTAFRQLHIKKNRPKSISIPFKIAHNLVIIPVQINESDTLRFILDSGVTHTLITNMDEGQTLPLEYSRKIQLYGLGGGNPIEALHSYGNQIQLPGVQGDFHDLLIPLDNVFYLSESLGTKVNGLIGYEIFNSFIVEVNYLKQRITLHDPDRYKKKFDRRKRRWFKKGNASILPITIERRKPYIHLDVANHEGELVNAKLLIDSGASNALSIYSETSDSLEIPEKSFRSFLGMGLNGEIHGEVSRLPKINVGNYEVNAPLVSFPDQEAIKEALALSDRNGSLGADVLRRFHVIYNYQDQEIILKPNSHFREAFKYNMSGLELVTPLPGLPVFQIAQIRNNSPADEAGLKTGDQIMAINGLSAVKYTLNDLVELFQSRPGRRIKINYQRNNKYFTTNLFLRDEISEDDLAESKLY